MNKLADSSSNNKNNNDDNTWEEIKQRLDNGASIRNIAFEYNDYYNVYKSKICNYFHEILIEKEEEIKKIQKKRKKPKQYIKAKPQRKYKRFLTIWKKIMLLKRKMKEKMKKFWK
jgi:hypothetical protein